MKKNPKVRFGIALVVLFFLLAIMVISALESVLFYEKFTTVETLEVLHNRMNHISRVVARLGNTLDIVVVGQRFEQITINILRNDVDRIDGEINKMLKKYTGNRVIVANKILSDELKGLPKEWREVYKDMKKFRANMSSDEVMLIHNDIDVDVLLLDEKLDKISAGITSGLKEVFTEIKILLLVSLTAFVSMLTVAAIFLYLRFISPMKKLELAAIAMASGRGENRFNKRMAGVFGRVAKELNTILEEADQRERVLEDEIEGLKGTIMGKERAIGALGAFFMESGRSFDSTILLNEALQKILSMTGADGVLVYIFEDNQLQLKASVWGGGKNCVPPPVIPADSIDDGTGVPVKINGAGAQALRAKGSKWMRSFAISPGETGDYGRLIMLFSDPPDEDKDGFIKALASAMGTSIAFIERLREEHDSREDCFTLINQLPLGIAVFEKDGSCVLANLIIKRFLGAAQDFDFVRDYRFTEDDVLTAQELVTTISKAYDGFVTEFIINYDPNLVRRYGFKGAVRDLRVNSVPLYEPGGKIAKIALIYEDITVTDEPDKGEDNKRL